MKVGSGGGIPEFQQSRTASLEQLADGLVAFAERKPSPAEVAGAYREITMSQLGPIIEDLYKGLAPVLGEAKDQAKQLELLEGAAKALLEMRRQIAGGRDFEVARALMGTSHGRLGGLLGTLIDSPTKLKVAWAAFELSAIFGRSQAVRT